MIIGNVARITATFTVDEVPTDATTVTLKVRSPRGPVATYTLAGGQVVRDSTGTYHCDVDADEVGRWVFVWQGSGGAHGCCGLSPSRSPQ